METSSHTYGVFAQIASGYEVILSNGEIKYITENSQEKDLFYSIPFSYGTLCFVTGVTLKIKPVKPFVK